MKRPMNWKTQRKRRLSGRWAMSARRTNKAVGYALYHDRQGRAIPLLRWSNLIERRRTYGRVERTDLRKQKIMVSTIWEGLDAGLWQHFGGSPRIFVTAVFIENTKSPSGMSIVFEQRSWSLKSARRTHNLVVHRLRALRSGATEDEVVETCDGV